MINLEFRSDNKNAVFDLTNYMDREKLNDELISTLKDADLTIKLSLKNDNSTIGIEKVNNKNEIVSKKENSYSDILLNLFKVNTEKSLIGKAAKVTLRVGEEIFDSTIRELFKKKFKWNYSVYNDAKSAAFAFRNNDTKKALIKGSDSLLGIVNKIPTSTKKIIKNAKNVAIDEVFS